MEIKNRVAESALRTFDLEDYYPKGKRAQLDIKDWLLEGLLLKEKDFREAVAAHDWSQYQDCYLAVYCSTDAILPGWTFMLLAAKASPFAKKVVLGTLEDLETAVFQDILSAIDLDEFVDRPVIIKGCGDLPVPPNAYLMATNKLQTVAKSVFYGEACSSVPLYKRGK